MIRAPEVVTLVSAASPDPAYGETDLQYATHTAELIARAPFFLNALAAPVTETYNLDNGSVWELISSIFKTHASWTIVRPYQKTRDGRNAYLALYAHHLGPSAVDNMSLAAEKVLKYEYKGETKKWNFDKYVRVKMDQYQILTDI